MKREEAGEISEQELLEYLIDTYQNLVFSICFKITGNYFDAEDLAQETFLSAYRKFSSFDGRNEKAWICRIATNKCLDQRRKAENRLIPTEDSFFVELSDKKASVEDNCMENFVKERLLGCCRQLKPPYHQVAEDYFYHEKTVSQMAKTYQKNEKTVQTQVYRAKAMLKKIYGKGEKDGREETGELYANFKGTQG